MSISYGCIPCFNYAIHETEINSLVMLSPDNILGSINIVNKKNLRLYFWKLFKITTFLKILSLNLNFKQIINNVISKQQKGKESPVKYINNKNEQIKILSIFGEKDDKKQHLMEYWKKRLKKHTLINFSSIIIPDSNHSFFGWQFKKDVAEQIVLWSHNKEIIEVKHELW